VEILGAPVERRDLDPGDEPDAPTLGFGCGLGDAVDRVMVGEREQLDARLRRRRDNRGRRERAVAVQRMALQVEGGRIRLGTAIRIAQ
jgi:hypothetical protein